MTQPTFNFRQLVSGYVGHVPVPAPEPRTRVYDHYLGIAKLDEPPYGTSGCKLADNLVIVCTRRPDPYRFAFYYAGVWHEHALVGRDDPGILALEAAGRIIHYGESPHVRIKQAQREAAEREEYARASGLQR